MPRPSRSTTPRQRIDSPFQPYPHPPEHARPGPRFSKELHLVRKPDYNRRVAVTGLGVISPVGNDKETAWSNLLRGVSGIGEITKVDVSRYEQKAAGEVKGFEAAKWMDPKAARRSESSLHFGVAAAKQALADSGFVVDDSNRTDVGVVFGSGAGGQQLMIDSFSTLEHKG